MPGLLKRSQVTGSGREERPQSQAELGSNPSSCNADKDKVVEVMNECKKLLKLDQYGTDTEEQFRRKCSITALRVPTLYLEENVHQGKGYSELKFRRERGTCGAELKIWELFSDIGVVNPQMGMSLLTEIMEKGKLLSEPEAHNF